MAWHERAIFRHVMSCRIMLQDPLILHLPQSQFHNLISGLFHEMTHETLTGFEKTKKNRE